MPAAQRPAKQDRSRSPARSALIVGLILAVVVAGAALFQSVGSEQGDVSQEPSTVPAPSGTPPPTVEPAPSPTAVQDSLPDGGFSLSIGQPDLDASFSLEPAPFGTYVVAKADAGALLPAVLGETGRREVPVYDEPGGQRRTLLDVNVIEGSETPQPLLDWNDSAGALVLRVIAGGPDDEWLVVQAATRPHDQYIWVHRADFDFGFTAKRIVIDLADEGLLQLVDGDEVVLRSPIVQGRPERVTPTHLTYVQSGVLGERVRPAFGLAILSMASYSEVLGSWSSGLPSNFIYGSDMPGLLGQRITSGSIRIPNERLERLIELITPGTPVLLFDSSSEGSGRVDILGRTPTPAATTEFPVGSAGPVDVTSAIAPQLWGRCVEPSQAGPLCRTDDEPQFVDAGSTFEHVFATAKPEAGDYFLGSDTAVEAAEFDPSDPAARVIPVFDEPYGPPRSLTYSDEINGLEFDYPLKAQTIYGQSLVLSVLRMTSDRQWLLVRAPVRPHAQAVWVRGSDFDLGTSEYRIEVDVGYEFLGRQGMLTIWNGGGEVMSAKISSGRETRPTTLTSTHIDQVIPGGLGPGYGPWIFSTPTYSDALGTFGGGQMPQQAIHAIGADLEDQLGEPLSAGSIHVSTETVERMAELDLVGARVVIYDSSTTGTGSDVIERMGWTAARTKPIEAATTDQPIGSFT